MNLFQMQYPPKNRREMGRQNSGRPASPASRLSAVVRLESAAEGFEEVVAAATVFFGGSSTFFGAGLFFVGGSCIGFLDGVYKAFAQAFYKR